MPKSNHISQLTGRRRKLSDGAMLDICKKFADGTASVQTLSKQYGVSTHLIYSVVYWTPRKAPQALPTPVSNEQEFIDRVKVAFDHISASGVEFTTNDILMEVGYGTPGEVIRALGKINS